MRKRPFQFVSFPGTPYVGLAGCAITAARLAPGGGGFFADREVLDLPCVADRRPGDVCLDAGAYIGYVTRALLDRGCRVYAFEPYPDAFACLAHNCPEGTLACRAVGDGAPAAPDDRYDGGNLGTRGLLVVPRSGRSEPTVRLDDLKLDRCDFLKVDVEGMEPMVLAGAATLLHRLRPVVLVEVFPDMLARRGFTVRDLFGRVPDGYAACRVTGTDERYDVLLRPTR